MPSLSPVEPIAGDPPQNPVTTSRIHIHIIYICVCVYRARSFLPHSHARMYDTYTRRWCIHIHVNMSVPGYRTRGLTSQRYIADLASPSKVTLRSRFVTRAAAGRGRERERERDLRTSYALIGCDIYIMYLVCTHVHARRITTFRNERERDSIFCYHQKKKT